MNEPSALEAAANAEPWVEVTGSADWPPGWPAKCQFGIYDLSDREVVTSGTQPRGPPRRLRRTSTVAWPVGLARLLDQHPVPALAVREYATAR